MTDPQYIILDSINDGALVLNRDYEIVFANHSFLTSHQLLLENIVGENCYTVLPLQSLPCLAQEIIEPVFQQGISITCTYVNFLEDGSKRILQISASSLKNERGEIIRLLQIIQDVTKQQKLQLESDQRLQQIIRSDKLASLGEVVAGVAHEINNPNSFITYNIPLLEEIWQMLQPLVMEQRDGMQETGLAGIPVSELCQDMNEIIEAIKVGSGRINQVVSNLKDFARLDESVLSKPVQLNEIVNKSYSIVGAQLRKATRNIEFHLEDDLPLVTGHFQKLEQVIANLLINAGHALQGHSRGEISISTRFIERLNSVIVSIEDNGVGMEPEALSRLFEPFFTTRRDSGGTGLGLSVSYGLVQEHGGRIGVLTKVGIGTRFTLFLPTNPDSGEVDLQPAVLLLEEEKKLTSVQDVLQESSESKIFTLSRQAAVSPFLADHPEVDIIFAPVKSLHINGWDLLQEIKKQFPLVKVVLSFERDARQVSKATGVGPDYMLQRPFSARQLMDAIDSFTRIRL